MKVLWLCNSPLSDRDASGTGTWLSPMARGLLDTGAIELGIIAYGPARQFTRCDYGAVKQWIVPSRTPLGHDGLPSAALVQAIIAAANEYSPDLIHSWGTEAFWGLLPARGLLQFPALLEIQGFKGKIAKVYCGDLTPREQICSIGIKELIKRRTMWADRRNFARWGVREVEIIRNHGFVDVQNPWVIANVKTINPGASLFQVDLALRQPFYDASGWHLSGSSAIFCIVAYPHPFKGLQLAIRALALLKKRIPNVRLRVAGTLQFPGIRQSGYMRWLNRTIRKLGLFGTIEWLGPLAAEQIVEELKSAGAVVVPSFIESSCTAMQEAMYIGTPVVASLAGGIPSLGKDEVSCLFFPPGDETMCAYQLGRVLTDPKLALQLSSQSRQTAVARNNPKRIVQDQLEIYRQVQKEN